MVAEHIDSARRADLTRGDTFASAVLRAANKHQCESISDVGCGSSPHLGLRLLALGWTEELLFIDWFSDALVVHYRAFCASVVELGLPQAPEPHWWPSPIFCEELDGTWLAIHGTLPRDINEDGTIRKPRGTDDGAALLRSLADTGASGVSAMLMGVEHDTFVAGAEMLGWPMEIEHGVLWAEFEPSELGVCVHIRFPAR
jgi:hypothetical protein